MGTNYYAVKKEPRVYDRVIHLGKSSFGWRFLFHETEDIRTFPQFKRWLSENIGDTKEYVLMNEYNEEVTVVELIELIEIKQKENNPDNFSHCKDIDGYRFSDREFS
jgi:hypothetical protein